MASHLPPGFGQSFPQLAKEGCSSEMRAYAPIASGMMRTLEGLCDFRKRPCFGFGQHWQPMGIAKNAGVGGLAQPESGLEFHLLWERQGGLSVAWLVGQSIPGMISRCPVHAYIKSHVVLERG